MYKIYWAASREKVPNGPSCYHTKRGMCEHGRAYPSFGMTLTFQKKKKKKKIVFSEFSNFFFQKKNKKTRTMVLIRAWLTFLNKNATCVDGPKSNISEIISTLIELGKEAKL